MDSRSTFNQLPHDKCVGPCVLIVDDEDSARRSMKLTLDGLEYAESLQVYCANSIAEAFDILAKNRIHVLFLDKNLGPDESDPDQNGIESIPAILEFQPHVKIVMVTGSADPNDAARAIQLGAFDYVLKREPSELLAAKVTKAIHHAKQSFNEYLLRRLQGESQSSRIGGKSEKWIRAVNRTKAFAESDLPILFLGETGTGKTTLARIAHEHRKMFLGEPVKNFVDVNIAAISSDMAERELFGNERGAFTDAREMKIGYFELAHQGTLFLDEIGEASLDLQKKLLKVIETQKFYRLGGTREIESKFKLIFATHRDLEKLVDDGKFREDLYHRIATLTIKIPSLEERKDDIPEIIRAFLPRIAAKSRVTVSFDELPADFVEHLVETRFKGNIRGIEKRVALLLALAPKDKSGSLVLSGWKRLLDSPEPFSVVDRRSVLSLSDLLSLPTDLIGPQFKGLDATIEAIEDRIYEEASRKYKSPDLIAKVLRVGRATAFRALKRIKKESQGASAGLTRGYLVSTKEEGVQQ